MSARRACLLVAAAGLLLAGAGAARARAAEADAPPADTEIQRALDRIDAQLPYLSRKRQPLPGEAELGRELFFDPRLSATGAMSCSTCHQPGQSFTDGLPRAVGKNGKALSRNTPTLIGGHYRRFLFWDGRVGSVEDAALNAIQNPDEMSRDLASLEKTLAGIPGYAQEFKKVYGADGATARRASLALGAFIAQLSTFDSPYDRFHDRGEPLPAAALRGLVLFAGKAGCVRCHGSPNFTSELFYDVGLRRAVVDDPGRFAVTKLEADRRAFRVPSLRNVGRTPPYMHDGSIATLREVVDFFDRGGDEPRPNSPLRPLGLTEGERRDLVAFLDSLSSAPQTVAAPLLPLSGAALLQASAAPAAISFGLPAPLPTRALRVERQAMDGWSEKLPALPDSGAPRCAERLTAGGLARRAAAERWRELDPAFVDRGLLPALEDYYLALAVADGRASRCEPLSAFAAADDSEEPVRLDARCRERYFEKRLAQALSGRLTDGRAACVESLSQQPSLGYGDAAGLCGRLLADPDQPEKACAAFVPAYLDPHQARACVMGLRSYRGRGGDCEALEDLETHLAPRCRLYKLFRAASDAGDASACGGSADCRVLMGEGRAVAAERELALLARACRLPAPLVVSSPRAAGAGKTR